MRTVPGDDHVRVEQDGAVLRLTLHRPEHRNALTAGMVAELGTRLRALVEEPDVRAVLLTGSGGAFCAGADLGGADPQDNFDGGSVDAANALVRAVVELDRPVVCGLDGVAAGVGLSLALACDVVVASPRARVSVAFTRIGLTTDGGASALLAASVGRARAMHLALTSAVLDAEEAYAAGLLSALHPQEEYEAALGATLAALAAGPPLALAATKKALNAATLGGLEAAFARERSGQAVLLRTADAAEGMAAFAAKRPAVFEGR